MAAAAAAVDPSLEASFQAACEAVAALSVAVLDEKNPERDWHRWMQAILDAVATRPIFKAELEFTGALNAVVALTAAQLASDDLAVVSAAGPSLRQRRQLALRALINNSLLEGGEARELIKDCVFASGLIGAVVQAFATLRTRYSTTKLPDDLNAEAVGLLQSKWPSKLDPLEFQAMVSDKIRVAQKLGFDATDATRAIWWPVISAPPKGHPMHAAAEMAYARTNGENATVTHRTRFIEVMLQELQRNHAAQTRSATEQRVKRSLLAEAHANLAQGEFEVNAAYRPRPPDKGSAMPAPAPGGGLVRHPCARGCKVAHEFGFKCEAVVECNTCGSENHIDEFCWIKNGLQAHNLRLPPPVAEQYELWHKQHVKGEYKKVAGGPPRVRFARTARPQKAPASSLASVSEDEDEYNANYCGSAAPDAHELDKWAQAVRYKSSSYAPAFTFGAGMVESFGALPIADRLTAETAGRWLALGDAPAPDMMDARRAEVAAAIAAEEAAAALTRAALAATIAAAVEAAKQAAEKEAAKRAAEEESAKRAAKGEAAEQAAKEEAVKQAAKQAAEKEAAKRAAEEESAKRAAKEKAAKLAAERTSNTAPTPWFILPF